MEISEGMYVKYIRGMINGYVPPRIAKATDCSDKDLIKIDNGQVILRNDILKASYNIINLIEENDYINGLRVEKNKYGELYTSYVYVGGDVGTQEEVYTNFLKDYDVKFIDNVVTKEQMESMAYKVE